MRLVDPILFLVEGGRFIGGHAMNPDNLLRTAAALSGLWSAVPMDRVRSGDGAIKLYGRRLAVHLMVQPGVRGFHQRLRDILARPLPTNPDVPNDLTTRRLGLAPEAKALWMRFHDEVEARWPMARNLLRSAPLPTRPPCMRLGWPPCLKCRIS